MIDVKVSKPIDHMSAELMKKHAVGKSFVWAKFLWWEFAFFLPIRTKRLYFNTLQAIQYVVMCGVAVLFWYGYTNLALLCWFLLWVCLRR